MKLPQRLAANPKFIFVTAKSCLSMVISLACVLTLGVDLPSPAVATGASRDKKTKQDPVLKNLPIMELSADEAILHALNRLGYGPRPGDVERVRQMGLAKWIEQQLNPNSIDDHAAEARLANYPTLRMSSAELIAEYPQPKQAAQQQVRQAQNGQGQTGAAGEQRRSDTAAATVAQDMAIPGNSRSAEEMTAPSSTGNTMEQNPNAPSPMKQNDSDAANVATRGAGGKRNALGGGDPNAVPAAIADDSKKPQRVIEELAMAKVTRAIYSERQLQQVLDDFWYNHFNVFAGKGEDRWYVTSYERDVIQPRTLGKFKDLVTATAESPAMLFYLDNFLSVDPNAAQRAAQERAMRQQARWGRTWPPRQPAQQVKGNGRGLNENYGRELMELHTLGVDGGYTQKDVTEVARCFTGWTIEKPRLQPAFKFDEKQHDPNPKIVLGKKIHAGGMKDGEEVIDLLVHQPATAKFISTELARRFISDTPPQALVERMAKTFASSDGDIRAVIKTMIYSPEFWSKDAYRAKVKTPFEVVVSAARALGTDVDTPMPLVGWIGRIGEPLYQCQPPTGYSDKAETWINAGALLNRLNYSLALAGNKLRGSSSDVTSLLGADTSMDAHAALDRAVQVFLGGQAGPTTVETLQKQLENPQLVRAKLDDEPKPVDLGMVAGLVLGAPEFQRR